MPRRKSVPELSEKAARQELDAIQLMVAPRQRRKRPLEDFRQPMQALQRAGGDTFAIQVWLRKHLDVRTTRTKIRGHLNAWKKEEAAAEETP